MSNAKAQHRSPQVLADPSSQRILTAALLGVAVAWFPTLSRCSIEWSLNAQYYYGWAVPFLAAYLAFERMPGAVIAMNRLRWVGAALMTLCLLPLPILRLVSEANSDWRLALWALAASSLGASLGLLYFCGGWSLVRRFIFPIAFLLTAVPWPTGLENLLVQGLMRLNAIVSAEFVSFCGVPAIAMGNVIELPTGLLGVNEACSGIRSLQSTLMASLFLGGLYRFGAIARIVMLGCGLVMAFAFNTVRTVFLSWQGAFYGIEATEKWHDSAGFAILGAVLIGLWLISWWFEKRQLRREPASAQLE